MQSRMSLRPLASRSTDPTANGRKESRRPICKHSKHGMKQSKPDTGLARFADRDGGLPMLFQFELPFDRGKNYWHYQPCANPVSDYQINTDLVVFVELHFDDVPKLPSSIGSRYQ